MALANNLLNGVESLIEDCSCSDAYISNEFTSLSELLGSELRVFLSQCLYEPDKLFELDDLIRYGLVNDVEVMVRESASGFNYRLLYEMAADLTLEKVIPFMREVSYKTSASGVEYMYVVLRDGSAELLEGEVGRIVIPSVRAALMIHTHDTVCIPSPNDLRTTTHILFDGGLGSGITSPTCYFLVFREGLLTEGDYLALKNLCKDECDLWERGKRYISDNIALFLG